MFPAVLNRIGDPYGAMGANSGDSNIESLKLAPDLLPGVLSFPELSERDLEVSVTSCSSEFA